MDIKVKIAESFNVLYQDVVNKTNNHLDDVKGFNEARDFVSVNYRNLDLSIMEFLAIYMLRKPNGKIEFQPSKSDVLDLLCLDDETLRTLTFAYDGVIVNDETKELAQKG